MYAGTSVCGGSVNIQFMCVCVCCTVPVFMCVHVAVFHFGINRLTLRCPRPPEPPVMYQRP